LEGGIQWQAVEAAHIPPGRPRPPQERIDSMCWNQPEELPGLDSAVEWPSGSDIFADEEGGLGEANTSPDEAFTPKRRGAAS